MNDLSPMKASAGTLAAIVAVIVLIFGGFALKVATSGWFGSGNAVIQKNDATNRIDKQEQFEQMKADFDAAVTNARVLRATAKTDPSEFNKTNAVGAVTYCVGVAHDYDALSRKYTAADFRSTDLPATLDAALCEGN